MEVIGASRPGILPLAGSHRPLALATCALAAPKELYMVRLTSRVSAVALASARLSLFALCAFMPAQAFAGPAEDAAPVFTSWKAAYDANDNVAVAKLYATDALLRGTRSRDVTAGREPITKYFTVVVGTGNKVEFREPSNRKRSGAARSRGHAGKAGRSSAGARGAVPASVERSRPHPQHGDTLKRMASK
jgi:hypothetical protein